MKLPSARNLFIVDGLGAAVSVFMLGWVLVKYQEYFGIHEQILYVLAAIPIFFGVFDLYSYFGEDISIGHNLRAIGRFNVSYCILSGALEVLHFNSITTLGWLYIGIEIAIVLSLARLQLTISKRLLADD